MRPGRFRWSGPPLALQIMGLLVGGLIVAQLVTLVLTLLLPPEPAAQYGLDDIAAALASGGDGGPAGLQRIAQAGPPDVSGPGWLVSERSRRELAALMGVRPERVTLAFYTPLPFAGTAAPRQLGMATDGDVGPLKASYRAAAPPAALILAQFRPGGGMRPSGDFGPRGFAPPRGDGLPPGLQRREGPIGGAGGFPHLPDGVRGGGGRPLIVLQPQAGERGIAIPGDNGAALPALLRGQALGPSTATSPGAAAGTAASTAASIAGANGVRAAQGAEVLRGELAPVSPGGFGAGGGAALRNLAPDRALLAPAMPTLRGGEGPAPLIVPVLPAAPPPRAPLREPVTPAPAPLPPIVSGPLALPPLAAARPGAAPAPPPPDAAAGLDTAGPPIRVAPTRTSLFGLAPAPFVQGDFVAALRLADGRWSVVQPAPEPFPNSWQRRVLLWFAVAFAVVLPLGWLFARRLVKPLSRFAGAAEQLGRDPAAAIGPLDGPAEIGRAARAFNQMQSRLRAFVDDRTAMIGAISHDLRTPLTRMRFRIEDVPDDVRDGLLEEVDAMEAMITQVIDFIRDASSPAARERLDLRALLGEAVADARLVGNDVTVEAMAPAPVEVDVLGMRRLLDNLLENAVKYGRRARIRLRTDADDVIADIIDEGPGVPDDELERVFEPFYRSEAARASDKAGSGLGLAVCRSIARAHGGDITLGRSSEGFRARVRVPRAFGPEGRAVFAE